MKHLVILLLIFPFYSLGKGKGSCMDVFSSDQIRAEKLQFKETWAKKYKIVEQSNEIQKEWDQFFDIIISENLHLKTHGDRIRFPNPGKRTHVSFATEALNRNFFHLSAFLFLRHYKYFLINHGKALGDLKTFYQIRGNEEKFLNAFLRYAKTDDIKTRVLFAIRKWLQNLNTSSKFGAIRILDTKLSELLRDFLNIQNQSNKVQKEWNVLVDRLLKTPSKGRGEIFRKEFLMSASDRRDRRLIIKKDSQGFTLLERAFQYELKHVFEYL